MDEVEEQITFKTITDFLDKNIESFGSFIRNQYGIILIAVTFLGGFVQIARLLYISPSAISYYSGKQSIIDGVLFIVFLILSLAISIFIILFILNVMQTMSKFYRIYLFIVANLTFIIVFVLMYRLHVIWTAMFLIVPLIGITFLLFVKEYLKYLNDKGKNIEDLRGTQKLRWIFIMVCFIFNGLVGYYDLSKEINSVVINKIYNYRVVESNLEDMGFNKFNVVYSNGDHVFLLNDKNLCLIIDIGVFTKDIFKLKEIKNIKK